MKFECVNIFCFYTLLSEYNILLWRCEGKVAEYAFRTITIRIIRNVAYSHSGTSVIIVFLYSMTRRRPPLTAAHWPRGQGYSEQFGSMVGITLSLSGYQKNNCKRLWLHCRSEVTRGGRSHWCPDVTANHGQKPFHSNTAAAAYARL